MALLLRMGGIPTRVVTGFSPGGYSKSKRAWVVRDTDAHSWVEAWFDDWGWVTFDPTPAGTPARSQIAALERAPETGTDRGDAASGDASSRSPGTGAVRPDLLGAQAGPGGASAAAAEEERPVVVVARAGGAAGARARGVVRAAVAAPQPRPGSRARPRGRRARGGAAPRRPSGRRRARRCTSSSSGWAARRRRRRTCGRCAPAATRRPRRPPRPAAAARCAASWRAAAGRSGGCARCGRCRRGGLRGAADARVFAAAWPGQRRIEGGSGVSVAARVRASTLRGAAGSRARAAFDGEIGRQRRTLDAVDVASHGASPVDGRFRRCRAAPGSSSMPQFRARRPPPGASSAGQRRAPGLLPHLGQDPLQPRLRRLVDVRHRCRDRGMALCDQRVHLVCDGAVGGVALAA